MNKNIDFDVKIKSKDEKGRVVIAGFANANTVDRGIERIDPKAWKLENYIKNPVVLYDHGLDKKWGTMPIGKATKVEARDGGLYTEIEISNSDHGDMPLMRDLIREGILSTFSVGFDPKNFTREGDVKVITEAELLETSVVPIPMNQDSRFSLLTKSLSPESSKAAKKWLSTIKTKLRAELILKTKQDIGCSSLVLLNLRMDKKTFKTVEEAKSYAKKYGYVTDNITDDESHFILKQSDAEYQDSILINLDESVQVEVKGQKMSKEDKELPKEGEDLPKEGEEPPKEGEELPKDGEEPPKEGEELPEEKAEITKEDVDAALTQWHDEAMACANNESGNPPSWVADEAAWEKAKEAADQSYSREDPEKYYSVVSWLYMNKFGGGKKEPGVEESKGCGNKEEEEKGCADKETGRKSAPIPTGSDAVDNNTSPLLDLNRQTNVLLGALISEVQRLNQSIEKLVVKPIESGETETMTSESEETQEAVETPEEDDDMKSYIARIRKNQDDLNMRLKSFQ